MTDTFSQILRRDPRAEWIARNRLHPLHDSVMAANGAEVRGLRVCCVKILMLSVLLGQMALSELIGRIRLLA
ncbi:hypothetical protein ONZ50_00510 [Marinomonas sp. GJ51-6]|nr:hypothetical protein [Marinomonas sp. GJ51-6]WOD07708.1 hypothetical protein ONZ50_00510 [Marinomonas sp. GJ51-6]